MFPDNLSAKSASNPYNINGKSQCDEDLSYGIYSPVPLHEVTLFSFQNLQNGHDLTLFRRVHMVGAASRLRLALPWNAKHSSCSNSPHY